MGNETTNDTTDTKRVMVELEEDLHRAFKLKCVENGTTMSEVVKGMVERWVKGKIK